MWRIIWLWLLVGVVIGIALKLIDVLIGYATKRSDQKSVQALEEIKAKVETDRQKAEIIRAQLGHWIAWLPKFLIELSAAIYFIAVITDSVWDLDGTVAALPDNEAMLLGVIFSGLFLDSAVRRFGRAQ